jgi:hypothetical protein
MNRCNSLFYAEIGLFWPWLATVASLRLISFLRKAYQFYKNRLIAWRDFSVRQGKNAVRGTDLLRG